MLSPVYPDRHMSRASAIEC